MYTIAIVEDDPTFGEALERLLDRHGYAAVRLRTGAELLTWLDHRRPDLILLDLLLPGLSGEQLLPYTAGIPVIVLSALADVEEKVRLLMAGASDYLSKPFDAQELLARIAVQLRGHGNADPVLRFADIALDQQTRQVTVQQSPVHLTRTEYAILRLLMRHPHQVLSKALMLESLSEDTPDCVESSLKVHISNLRAKLRAISGGDYIESVWGIGFKLRAEDGALAQA